VLTARINLSEANARPSHQAERDELSALPICHPKGDGGVECLRPARTRKEACTQEETIVELFVKHLPIVPARMLHHHVFRLDLEHGRTFCGRTAQPGQQDETRGSRLRIRIGGNLPRPCFYDNSAAGLLQTHLES
jgi:hypothetical protein